MAFGHLGYQGRGFGILGADVSLIQILLSSNTVSASATVGTTIGTLSVVGGTGVYTFSLTSNPGGLFSISGSNLQVAASLSAGNDPITVQANNGAGSIVTQNFIIVVTGNASDPVPIIFN